MSETQPPPPGMDARTLGDLAQAMLDAADHWLTLSQPDRAIQCHQAAAMYANASALAYVNYQPPPPAEDAPMIKPLWMRTT